VIISIVIALFTAPLNFIIDYLFTDIIQAPTEETVADREKKVVMAQAGRRVVSAVRRASATAGTAVRAAVQRIVSEKPNRVTINVVPESTLLAQGRARGATSLLMASLINSQQAAAKTTDYPEKPEEMWKAFLAELVAERDRTALDAQSQFDVTWGY
jgi:hypothetical protein